MAERQARKLWISIFIVFGLIQSKIEVESTSSESDALQSTHSTTDRLFLLQKFWKLILQRKCMGKWSTHLLSMGDEHFQ